MENELLQNQEAPIEFNGSINDLHNELFGVNEEVEESPVSNDSAIEEIEEPSKEIDEDNAIDSDEEVGEVKSEEDEELDRLEAAEKWRVKRLNKEIEKRKELEAELAKYKQGEKTETKEEVKESSPQINTHQDIVNYINEIPQVKELINKVEYIRANKEKFNTLGEYADALVDAKSELKDFQMGAYQQITQEMARRQSSNQAQEAKIYNDYKEKVDSIKDEYPKIDKALENIEKIAGELHVDIRRALLTDENAAYLTWRIGSSKSAMELLKKASINATKNGVSPVEAIKAMGKWATEKSVNSSSPVEAKIPAKNPINVPRKIRDKVSNKPIGNSYEDIERYLKRGGSIYDLN